MRRWFLLLIFLSTTVACGEPVTGRTLAMLPSDERSDGAELIYAPSSPESAQNPAFSPDGSRIVFTRFESGYNDGPAGLFLLDLGSSTVITRLTPVEDQDNVNMPGSAWNEVNDRIVFASDRMEADDLWRIAPDGSDFTRVTTHTGAPWYIEPSWSPDGQWIVFESDAAVPDDQQQGSIWKVRANGTDLTPLTDGPGSGVDDREPNWSPSGDRILFQRRTPGSDDWNLYTMATDGSDLRQVTTAPSSDTDASWSPDGSCIVYSSDYYADNADRTGRTHSGELPVANIYVISATGGVPIRVTNDDTYDGAPSWSPDGTGPARIAFESSGSQSEDSPSALWRIAVPEGACEGHSVYLPLITSGFTASSSNLSASASTATPVYIRLNQVGYLPAEPKLALALTDEDLSGQTFSVVTAPGGSAVFTGSVGADRGAYGDFAHLYELSFTGLTAPGRYRLRVGSESAPSFTIGANVYAGVIPPTLQFFRVQRCGDTAPVMHGVCHLNDGIASGGPVSGTAVNVTGGWHDAGDYLKFAITTGASTNLMLAAYQRHPEVFADTDHNGAPDVLDEARVGLDWMLKLWDPANDVLYYQVGDESDHDTWRMPEDDDADRPTRPVWACETGKGANVAGKIAAALASAASLWNDPARSFYSPTLASTYQTAAQQIYDYGQARPAAQSSTSGFYDETSWQDDMALAAAELYRATGETTYLNEARNYAAAAGNAWSFDWGNMHGLAHYELARLDSTFVPSATAWLEADLAAMQIAADANPFRAALSHFYWGSAEAMVGVALEALWYQDLSGDATYHALAQAQRDYVLGGNPWGVCWVNSLGVTWPRHPHHQVADLTDSELVGFWDEGPMPRADWQALGITLSAPDTYAAFQSDAAVYHDDVADYATNEPTIIANALGLALTTWYAPAATTFTHHVYLPIVTANYTSPAGPIRFKTIEVQKEKEMKNES